MKKSFYSPEHSISYSFLSEEIPFKKEKTDTYTVKMSEDHYFSNSEKFKEVFSNREEYYKKECFKIFINPEKNNHSYNKLIRKDFTKTFFNNIETYISGNYGNYFSVKNNCSGTELSHSLFSNPELIKKFHCEYFKISTTLFFEKHRVGEKYENCKACDKIKITYDLNTQKSQIEVMVCTNKSFLSKELFYTTGILKEDNKFEITKIESLSTEYVVQDTVPVEYKRFDGGGSPGYFSVKCEEIFNNKETYSDFKKIKGFNEKEVLNKFEKFLNDKILVVKEVIEENKTTVKKFAEKFYGDYFENKEKVENEINDSEKELDVQKPNEYDYDYDDDCEL